MIGNLLSCILNTVFFRYGVFFKEDVQFFNFLSKNKSEFVELYHENKVVAFPEYGVTIDLTQIFKIEL